MHLGAELITHAQLGLDAWQLFLNTVTVKLVASGSAASEEVCALVARESAQHVLAVVHEFDELFALRELAGTQVVGVFCNPSST